MKIQIARTLLTFTCIHPHPHLVASLTPFTPLTLSPSHLAQSQFTALHHSFGQLRVHTYMHTYTHTYQRAPTAHLVAVAGSLILCSREYVERNEKTNDEGEFEEGVERRRVTTLREARFHAPRSKPPTSHTNTPTQHNTTTTQSQPQPQSQSQPQPQPQPQPLSLRTLQAAQIHAVVAHCRNLLWRNCRSLQYCLLLLLQLLHRRLCRCWSCLWLLLLLLLLLMQLHMSVMFFLVLHVLCF